ncbi:hypothetical protein Efla_005619 [Eimeria flavescens]
MRASSHGLFSAARGLLRLPGVCCSGCCREWSGGHTTGPTPGSPLLHASTRRRAHTYAAQPMAVKEALARLSEMHLRGMHASRGPWRRLLRRLNGDMAAVAAEGEAALLSVASALSASLKATACPSPEGHLFAANVLQLLAGAPEAAAAAAGPAAAAAEAAAARRLCPSTQLRLLLLLHPLAATHPERRSLLSAQRRTAAARLRLKCLHAIQRVAGEEEDGSASTPEGDSSDASLFAAVSSNPFEALELLLDATGHSHAEEEQQQALLLAAEDAASRLLLSRARKDKGVQAALVAARLLIMKLQATRTDCCSSNSSSSSSTNGSSGNSSSNSSSTNGSSGSSISNSSSDNASSSHSSSSSTNSTNSNSSNSCSNWRGSVGLETLALRLLLRAPLLVLPAEQIEVAFAALDALKTVVSAKGEAQAEEGEGRGKPAAAAAAGVSLVSAAEAHIAQAAAERAPQLEPQEVLQVVTAALQCDFFGSRWLADVFKRGCNLKDAFSRDERAAMHAATRLILSQLHAAEASGGAASCAFLTPAARMQELEKNEVAASAAKSEPNHELRRILQIVLKLNLFQQPHRSNVSWTSGRSHLLLSRGLRGDRLLPPSEGGLPATAFFCCRAR